MSARRAVFSSFLLFHSYYHKIFMILPTTVYKQSKEYVEHDEADITDFNCMCHKDIIFFILWFNLSKIHSLNAALSNKNRNDTYQGKQHLVEYYPLWSRIPNIRGHRRILVRKPAYTDTISYNTNTSGNVHS